MPAERASPEALLEGYDASRITVAAVASHSALDVFDGAKDYGFPTLAICQRGREKPYLRFRRVVDDCMLLDRFADAARPENVEELRRRNAVLVPNRSFAVYLGYDTIEERFPVPIYGNRWLLRYEERTGEKNYYRLLDEAGIRRPRVYRDPDEIDRPVIVKMPHARKRVERGFFIAIDRDDFWRKLERLERDGVVKREDLASASIEELVLGAHFNVNYFYSVARGEVELLSIDRRIQTNLDGFLHMTADAQLELLRVFDVEYVEIGHTPATIRERMLNQLIEIGDRLAEATRRLEPPGVIGPFTLQLMVTPELEVVVFDVALRIGGGTNIYMGVGSQYSKLIHGRPLSTGQRIGLELRECVERGCLEKAVT